MSTQSVNPKLAGGGEYLSLDVKDKDKTLVYMRMHTIASDEINNLDNNFINEINDIGFKNIVSWIYNDYSESSAAYYPNKGYIDLGIHDEGAYLKNLFENKKGIFTLSMEHDPEYTSETDATGREIIVFMYQKGNIHGGSVYLGKDYESKYPHDEYHMNIFLNQLQIPLFPTTQSFDVQNYLLNNFTVNRLEYSSIQDMMQSDDENVNFLANNTTIFSYFEDMLQRLIAAFFNEEISPYFFLNNTKNDKTMYVDYVVDTKTPFQYIISSFPGGFDVFNSTTCSALQLILQFNSEYEFNFSIDQVEDSNNKDIRLTFTHSRVLNKRDMLTDIANLIKLVDISSLIKSKLILNFRKPTLYQYLHINLNVIIKGILDGEEVSIKGKYSETPDFGYQNPYPDRIEITIPELTITADDNDQFTVGTRSFIINEGEYNAELYLPDTERCIATSATKDNGRGTNFIEGVTFKQMSSFDYGWLTTGSGTLEVSMDYIIDLKSNFYLFFTKK